jgi:hypothetical protein
LQTADQFRVDVNRGPQLANFFLQDFSFTEQRSDAKAKALLKGCAFLGSRGSGGSCVFHDLALLPFCPDLRQKARKSLVNDCAIR